MERIQSLRASLQHLVDSPRASFLWAFMLCVFTLTFLGQVVGASYVYTIVRLGMDGQKTQQEKKIEQEVQLIYEAEKYTDELALTESRPKAFEEALMRRTAKEEVDASPTPNEQETKIEKNKAPTTPEQKKENKAL